MIYIPSVTIGFITIYTWGFFVALGMIVGLYLAKRTVKNRGLDVKKFERIGMYMIIAGFVGARLGHIIFYDPSFFIAHPFEILKIWHGGMSSMGGFFLAALVGSYLFYKEKLSLWLYGDCTMLGLTAGWTIGRIGCFLIHDHPGTLSDFALASQFPDGTRRHDLGLYDGLLTLGLFVVVLATYHLKLRAGMRLLFVTLIYSIVRFFLDFLRVADVRYVTLTPAQYACIILAIFSSVIIHSRFKSSLAS